MKYRILTIGYWLTIVLSMLIGLVMLMYGLLANDGFILFCGVGLLGVAAYIYERYLNQSKK